MEFLTVISVFAVNLDVVAGVANVISVVCSITLNGNGFVCVGIPFCAGCIFGNCPCAGRFAFKG